MEAWSELPLTAEHVPSVLFADRAQPVGPLYVADEEFPADFPVEYDWMLQPAAQRVSRRVLAVLVVTAAVLLIVVSFYLVHRIPRSFPTVSSLPSSSSR
jgi:hypothetical protein